MNHQNLETTKFCKCKVNNCINKKCSCKLNGIICNDKCICMNCENKSDI